jgi:hypothetical protein
MVRKIEADERQPSTELAHLLVAALQIPSEQQEFFVAVARLSETVSWQRR